MLLTLRDLREEPKWEKYCHIFMHWPSLNNNSQGALCTVTGQLFSMLFCCDWTPSQLFLPSYLKDSKILSPRNFVVSLLSFSQNSAPWNQLTQTIWWWWFKYFCLGDNFHLILKRLGNGGSLNSHLVSSVPLDHPRLLLLHQFSAVNPKVDTFSSISRLATFASLISLQSHQRTRQALGRSLCSLEVFCS